LAAAASGERRAARLCRVLTSFRDQGARVARSAAWAGGSTRGARCGIRSGLARASLPGEAISAALRNRTVRPVFERPRLRRAYSHLERCQTMDHAVITAPRAAAAREAAR
jgi:hypothetical protein